MNITLQWLARVKKLTIGGGGGKRPELDMRIFLGLSRSRAEPPALELLGSFIGHKIRVYALKRSVFFSLVLFYSLFFAIVVSRSCVYICIFKEGEGRKERIARI
jgi:hypothetical protein